jgi:hypothetical protein
MMTKADVSVVQMGEGGNRVQARRYGVSFEQTAYSRLSPYIVGSK